MARVYATSERGLRKVFQETRVFSDVDLMQLTVLSYEKMIK